MAKIVFGVDNAHRRATWQNILVESMDSFIQHTRRGFIFVFIVSGISYSNVEDNLGTCFHVQVVLEKENRLYRCWQTLGVVSSRNLLYEHFHKE